MMLIRNGICQYVRRYAVLNKIYAIFSDRYRARFPEKNSKAQKHIQIFSMLRSGFFPQNTLGDGPAFWIFFFQDSRIRVKAWTNVISFVGHASQSPWAPYKSLAPSKRSLAVSTSINWNEPGYGHSNIACIVECIYCRCIEIYRLLTNVENHYVKP